MTHSSQTNPALTLTNANKHPSFTQAAPDKELPLRSNVFIENMARSKKTSPDANSPAGVQPLKNTLAFMYVLSCQRDNCMIYVDSQIASLGFAPEEWLGKPDLRLRLVHEEDFGKFDQAMRHSRNSGVAFSCQYRLYDSCGKMRWLHDEASLVCDKSGAALFFSGVMLDITDKKEMEAELHEHRYRLERSVAQRTEQLVRSMTVLESCNAALCDKLTSAHKELAALKRQLAGNLFGAASNDCAEPLYVQL